MHHISERQGRIDILVNNAGYPFDRKIWNKRFHEVTEDDFERVIDVDLKGTFRLSQAADSDYDKKCRNQQTATRRGVGGVIINIASTPADLRIHGRCPI